MKKTLDSFNDQRSQALAILEKLQVFLQQGESVGAPVDANLTSKLNTALKSIADDKLKIALVGGFSEGKTSIAAAWMEQLDKATMKISHQESSNEVKIYEVGDDCVLIDTPGLFGFKEQYNADEREIEKFKDITKKYVSEAHLILYVMNSTNPIKESHREDMVWLFKTLNLLPRTVFVLSRFDEVADVEDEWEYKESLKIKRNNVVGRLKDLLEIDQQEENALSIVAVAANPFDMGTEYWLNNLKKFKELSHISLLQEATTEKVKISGGAAAIVDEAKKSIIRDVLTKQLPIAVANDEKIGQEVDRLEDMNLRLQKQLSSTQGQISDVRVSLRVFVAEYFSDLILQAKGLDINTFTDFFEREVGSEGVVLAARLQSEFERQLRSVNLEISNMAVGLQSEINHFNNAVTMLGKQGVSYIVKSNLINNTTVLATRDGIVTAAKTVGMDLGKFLKFKPWGAVNLAKGINGALAFVGVAIEVWDSWEQTKREEALRGLISDMVTNFEKQRAELLDLINGPGFIKQFFAGYVELEGNVQEIQQSVISLREKRCRFNDWRKAGEVIEAEFSAI